MWANPPSVQVRHRTLSRIAALCLPQLKISRRRYHMAHVHPARAKPWIDVPRMGSCFKARPRSVHRYLLSPFLLFAAGVDYLVIDTMGYAFTFHVVSILTGINIGAYVHYPTISTEMIHRVESRVALHNNSASVSSSTFLTQGKLLQVTVPVIRSREHDTDIRFVTGIIAYSCSSTRSLSEKPLSSWLTLHGQKRTSTRFCTTTTVSLIS